jgi:hypothetical protein
VSAGEGRVELRSISPDATAEEVAAIAAAIAASMATVGVDGGGDGTDDSSTWVRAARITARRGGYARGEWRLSGRLGRRSRA